MVVYMFLFVLSGFFAGSIYILFRVLTRDREISKSAAVMNVFLQVIRIKKFLIWAFRNPMRSRGPLRASRKFNERYEVTYHCVGGVEFLTAKPRNSAKSIHLVYLHGGAYIIGRNGVGISEPLISSLMNGTGARLTFIDYPVAPESCFTDTLKGVYDVYLFLNRQYGDDVFVLVGDSAGGGLALSFAQMIKGDHNVVQPGRIVVFSPWLDLSLDNPGAQLEESDMILSRKALVYASLQYAGVEELRNPLVSPIYGDFSGLPRVLMFFGARELFYADGLRMRGLAEENGWDVVLRFYPEMPHDWVLMPIRESRRAISEASGFILEYEQYYVDGNSRF